MEDIVDMHCHILPEVDDGAEGIEESLAMLRREREEGVRKVILTPHYRRGMFETPREKIKTVFSRLQREVQRKKVGVDLFLGCEFYRENEILDILKRDQSCRMAGTSYVLLEFSTVDSYSVIRNYTMGLLNHGYRPVIAHAERYEALRKMDAVQSLAAAGAYIQVNAGSILGKNGWSSRRFCKKLLKDGHVHLVGSDAHNMRLRAPCMGACARYLEKKLGNREAYRILSENPEKLIRNEYI